MQNLCIFFRTYAAVKFFREGWGNALFIIAVFRWLRTISNFKEVVPPITQEILFRGVYGFR